MTCLAERLAAFALSGTPPTHGARAMLRLSLLDWAACGLAGRDEPVARILAGEARSEGGVPQSGLIGGGRVPARAAALVNGAMSHALDYDDTHFAHIGHPSVAVIPAALAVAEGEGAEMADFAAAALVGVEASVRVGLWLGRGHYQAGFHQTATAGAFGAVLACARLLQLDFGQTCHALGLTATRAAGLKSQFGTMGKPLNAGLAAETGVMCALWAARGMVSNPAALDGPQGFGPTHHGAGDLSPLEDLGASWLFERVSHKFHACCHGLHAMLEALAGVDVDHHAVDAVEVRTHPRWLSVCNQPEPQTGLEAKFSYRLTAAMALCGVDTAAIPSFSEQTARDPRLVRLRDRVTVVSDSALSETEAQVEITLADGQRIAVHHDLSAPIPLDQCADRLRHKAESLLGGDRARALWDAAHGDDLDALTDALAG